MSRVHFNTPKMCHSKGHKENAPKATHTPALLSVSKQHVWEDLPQCLHILPQEVDSLSDLYSLLQNKQKTKWGQPSQHSEERK